MTTITLDGTRLSHLFLQLNNESGRSIMPNTILPDDLPSGFFYSKAKRIFSLADGTYTISLQNANVLTSTEGIFSLIISNGYIKYNQAYQNCMALDSTKTILTFGWKNNIKQTIDARNMLGKGFCLDSVFGASDSKFHPLVPLSYTNCQLLPSADGYYGQIMGGDMIGFNFKVGLDGTFNFNPKYHAVASGANSYHLNISGFPILIDARSCGTAPLQITGVSNQSAVINNHNISSKSRVVIDYFMPMLFPNSHYSFNAPLNNEWFTVDVNGNAKVSSGLKTDMFNGIRRIYTS